MSEEMTTVTISVTDKDIANGTKESCFFCPIANAMARTFLDSVPQVEHSRVWLGFGTEHIRFNLPESAQEFIKRFDRQQHVEPFTFDLAIPSRLLHRATGKEVAQ